MNFALICLCFQSIRLLLWTVTCLKWLYSANFILWKYILQVKQWNLNMMVLFISFCWLFLNIFICWSIGIWMEIIQYIAFLTKHRFTKKRNLLNNPLHVAVASPFFCIISLLALFYDKSYILIQKHYYYIEYYVVWNDRF